MEKIKINPEDLALWYFRLNGFFTIPNFVIHPDYGSDQRTDIDIFGVRFPNRQELLVNSMEDDSILTNLSNNKILIILAEVKTQKMKINESWTDKLKENMQRALNALGIFPISDRENIANNLYLNGFFENDTAKITWVCIGDMINKKITKNFPSVPVITHNQIFNFIYSRFKKYHNVKASHNQWDAVGKNLFKAYKNSNNVNEYKEAFELISNQ
jgi:hypothetical protein